MNLTLTNQRHTGWASWPADGYDPATGTLPIGHRLDDGGAGRWRLFTDDRALCGGLLVGDAASGKSRTIEGLALAATDTGAVIWFGDTHGGANSPMLMAHAAYTAGSVQAIGVMLHRAVRIMRDREATTTARPGLLVIVDSAASAFTDPAIQAMAIEVARDGGPHGVALLAAEQSIAQPVFGPARHAESLRSTLCADNLLMLHTTDRTAAALAGYLHLDADPARLPARPGHGVLAHAGGPLRVHRLDDTHRDQWAARLTWPGHDTTPTS